MSSGSASLVEYLHGNYEMASERFARELPAYKVTPMEGTYLMWVDVSASGLDGERFAALLEERARVMVSPGIIYGEAGSRFIRINLAAPRAVVGNGVGRIITFANSL